MTEPSKTELDKVAEKHGNGNLLLDFVYFLRYNKKWWLVPIILLLLLLGLLMFVSTSGIAPFIYTLF